MTDTTSTPDPAPIPEARALIVPWPQVRPLGIPLSAAGLKEAWESIVVPLADDGPQSIEVRCLMAALRALYDGMHGITYIDPELERTTLARAIHDGPNAQAQYAKSAIAPHVWDECPYQAEYLADADAVLAAGYRLAAPRGD